MKKKTLLTLITVTMLSLAACGKTEETADATISEPVPETQITESQPEPPETPMQESQEVVENTDTVTDEVPVETEE